MLHCAVSLVLKCLIFAPQHGLSLLTLECDGSSAPQSLLASSVMLAQIRTLRASRQTAQLQTSHVRYGEFMTLSSTADGLPPEDPIGRRGSLMAWGVVLIVLGSVMALGMIGHLGFLTMSLEQSLATPPRRGAVATGLPNWRILLVDGVVLAWAAALLAAGIGACQAKRWCRPIVLVSCGFVIAYGLLQLVTQSLDLPRQLDRIDPFQGSRPTAVPTQTSIILLFSLNVGLLIGLAIVLPYVMYRYFASERTVNALDALDPRRLWSDRIPPPVLGWATLLVMGAFGAAMSLGRPSIPLFIVVLSGPVSLIATAVCIVVFLWCTWLTLRVDRIGWIISFVLVALLQLGGVVYFLTGGSPADLMIDWSGQSTAPQAVATDAYGRPLRRSAVAERPAWQFQTISVLETLMVLGFGVYVSTAFPRKLSSEQPLTT